MADLTVSEKYLCVSHATSTIVIPVDSASERIVIHHAEDQKSSIEDNCEKLSSVTEYNYDGGIPSVSSVFSPCGSLFACCSNKLLSVWDTNNWTLTCKKIVQRSVSKIMFTPNGQAIVIADKSGDVYIHSLKNISEPGSLILGHVSMLLDVLVTKDQQYIITSDRDEKIRVSCFPDAYKITSYCLGHEHFVTSINILPNDSATLLSSSGDGTFRLWDYINSKELLCYDVRQDISSNNDDIPPVIYNVALLNIDKNNTVVCCLIYKTNAVWVYSIQRSELFSFKFLHSVTLAAMPCCLQAVNSSSVLCFLDMTCIEPIISFKLESNKLVKSCENYITQGINVVQSHLKGIDMNALLKKKIDALFKKKFDDESEYIKRKNKRLEATRAKRLAK